MKWHTLILIAAGLSSQAWAEPPAPKSPVPMARRIEVLSRQNFWEPIEKGLKPNRLYGVVDPATDNWVFVLSDKNGILPRPLEAFAPGSVVASENVGGETGKRYLLGLNSKWTPTDLPAQRRLWIMTQPVSLRLRIPKAPDRQTASVPQKTPIPSPKGLFGK